MSSALSLLTSDENIVAHLSQLHLQRHHESSHGEEGCEYHRGRQTLQIMVAFFFIVRHHYNTCSVLSDWTSPRVVWEVSSRLSISVGCFVLTPCVSCYHSLNTSYHLTIEHALSATLPSGPFSVPKPLESKPSSGPVDGGGSVQLKACTKSPLQWWRHIEIHLWASWAVDPKVTAWLLARKFSLLSEIREAQRGNRSAVSAPHHQITPQLFLANCGAQGQLLCFSQLHLLVQEDGNSSSYHWGIQVKSNNSGQEPERQKQLHKQKLFLLFTFSWSSK